MCSDKTDCSRVLRRETDTQDPVSVIFGELGAARRRIQQLQESMDSKFGLYISVLRFMLAAAGVMTGDDFDASYQQYMDEFTKRYGDDQDEGSQETEQ